MGAAALLRMKEMVLPSVLLLLAIVLGPMNFQFPSLRSPEGGSAFSVLSYNVRAGLGGKEAIAEYLRANGSDQCRSPQRHQSSGRPSSTRAYSR